MAPNDEFIREVDDEYRRDRIAQLWKRHNGLIIGVAVLVLASVGGWRYWEHLEQTRAHAAGARYEEALRLSRDDKSSEAQAAFEALAKDSDGGYALLTRFRLAAELGGENSATAYDALANDSKISPLWQDLARLRASWLRLDSAEPAVVRPPLERLAVPTNPWRHTARELLGLSGLKTGEMDFAGKWFDQIAADRETPPSLKQRLAIYTALAAGGPVQVTQ